jgi:hypothetical protein
MESETRSPLDLIVIKMLDVVQGWDQWNLRVPDPSVLWSLSATSQDRKKVSVKLKSTLQSPELTREKYETWVPTETSPESSKSSSKYFII